MPPIDKPAALAAIIEAHRNTPFAWGVHDCCLWAATAVQAQTGVDHAEALRGKYHSKRGAVEVIRTVFGGRIENIPTQLGFPRVPIARAQRGWLVSHTFAGRGTSLGVCAGARSVFAGPDGLVFVPTSNCRKAWRVG